MNFQFFHLFFLQIVLALIGVAYAGEAILAPATPLLAPAAFSSVIVDQPKPSYEYSTQVQTPTYNNYAYVRSGGNLERKIYNFAAAPIAAAPVVATAAAVAPAEPIIAEARFVQPVCINIYISKLSSFVILLYSNQKKKREIVTDNCTTIVQNSCISRIPNRKSLRLSNHKIATNPI